MGRGFLPPSSSEGDIMEYVIKGMVTILDVIEGDDQDQAERRFRAKYRGATILEVAKKKEAQKGLTDDSRTRP